MSKLKLCIDVGGTKTAYGLLDDENHIVYRFQTPTPLEIMPDEFTEKIYTETDEVLKNFGCAREELSGVAVGMPSYVDYENGIVVTSGSIHNIKNYPARAVLEKKFPGIPVLIDGDTNMAALAEHYLGSGQGFPHMVYVALSTGLGTGFIIDGRLFRGSYGGAGESGHMIITPGEGLTDGCGNPGCFMSYACGSYIVKHAVNAIESGIPSSLKDMVSDLSELTANCGGLQAGGFSGRKTDEAAYQLFSPAYLQSVYCVQYQLLCMRRRPDQYGRLFPGKDPGGG